MSRDNAELVRRNNDAYNRRDLSAYLETVSEAVEFRSRFSAMDNRGYSGHDALRGYFAELDETWQRYTMHLERLVEDGPRVVGLFHLEAIGRESGLELEERPGVVFTVEAGRIVQIDAYPSHAEALAAAGLPR
jgi:ketosteroid isomerase-like protein